MKMRIAGVSAAMLTSAALAGLAGCNVVRSTPTLPPGAFVANQQMIGPQAGQGTDQSGQLVVGEHHRAVKPVPADDHVSDVVRDVVKSPTVEVATTRSAPTVARAPSVGAGPTTQSTTQPGQTTGRAQWIGSVIATVDYTPIFADKVLARLDRSLATEARAGDEAHFRLIAQDLINRQIQELIYNELEFAAAKKSLEKKDEDYASRATMEWRKEQVRKFGGSEQAWRQRVAEEGLDFEELLKEQYRSMLTQLYYQTKIYPLIQVTAQDMRQFYQANIRNFQTPASVKFRVLWVSTELAGGREAALKKAQEAYQRASSGEDFSDVFAKFNDDLLLKATKGIVGGEKRWMERGAFAVPKVEDAVWDLQVFKVTVPIEARNQGRDGYWVAKLDEIRPGKSEAFENPRVQEAIRGTLRREQLIKLRQIEQQKLQSASATRLTPGYNEVMMQMVMQRYRVWGAPR